MFVDEEDGRHTIVPLRREPFQLQFPDEFAEPGIAICAWNDESIMSLPRTFRPYPIDQTSCLPPEKTMAKSAPNDLVLTQEANNFFGGPGVRRVDGRVVVDITDIYSPGREAPGAVRLATYHGPLFLLVFVNINDDDAVNNSEYEYLELRF